MRFAESSVVPAWHPFVEDDNIYFLITNDRVKEEFSSTFGALSERILVRAVYSIEAYAKDNQSFGLLSFDGKNPDPDNLLGENKVVRIALVHRRFNPSLDVFLDYPFVKKSDLIVSDYLPEESISQEDSNTTDVALEPVPDRFTFKAHVIPDLSKSSKSNDAPLLWIVDPEGMATGKLNEKVASILGRMDHDKQLQVLCLESGLKTQGTLMEYLSNARGILAVTGDPVLGHFLLQAACVLGIPVVFPIEEPCSPFRFNSKELSHYLTYNNYGRAGLSLRGLILKGIEYADAKVEEQISNQTAHQVPEAPSLQWEQALAEKDNKGESNLAPSPNGHEVISLNTETCIESEPVYEPTAYDKNKSFDISLTQKPWLGHPVFLKAVLALQARPQIPESITLAKGFADYLVEDLLALKPTLMVAENLFRNFAWRDPEWLLRTREKVEQWWRSGSNLDVARCIKVAYLDFPELNLSNSNRREEFQGLADLLTLQVNSNIASDYMPTPLFRFLSALNLVSDRSKVVRQVFTAHPTNEGLYRSLLSFWGLVNENSETCQEFAPHYSDDSNLTLSYGHFFLFVAMANESLPNPVESMEHCLSKGYFEKWINMFPLDRILVCFVISLVGLVEEAQKLFDKTIADNPEFSSFAHSLSKVPDLYPSGKTLISDDIQKKLAEIIKDQS